MNNRDKAGLGHSLQPFPNYELSWDKAGLGHCNRSPIMNYRGVDKPFPAIAQDRESMSSLGTRIGDSSNSSNQ